MKYKKYWGNIEKMNLLLFVAIVLDPRYKIKYIFIGSISGMLNQRQRVWLRR